MEGAEGTSGLGRERVDANIVQYSANERFGVAVPGDRIMVKLPKDAPSGGGRVALLDKYQRELFTLKAEVDGVPCRVVEVTKKGVIRLLAPKPGELRLQVNNCTLWQSLRFEIVRKDNNKVAGSINDWHVAEPGRINPWLDRDATTARVMMVEAVRDAEGRVVPEADPRAAVVPRTRFELIVLPLVEDVEEWNIHCRRFWNPSKWVAMAGVYPPASRAAKVFITVTTLPESRRIDVELSTTVAELKAAVRELSPAPPGSAATLDHHQLYLASGGAQLANDKKLSECSVEAESSLLLFPVPDIARRSAFLPVRVLFEGCGEAGGEEAVTAPLTAGASVATLKAMLPKPLKLRLPGAGRRFAPPDDCSLFYLASLPGDDPVKAIDEDARMQVFVDSMIGDNIVECYVGPQWTVDDVKHMVAAKVGGDMDVDRFRLLFGAQRLVDSHIIAEYPIQAGDTLLLIPRLAGGTSKSPPGTAKGPLVARVVPGAERAPPQTRKVDLEPVLDAVAPILTLEVSLDTLLDPELLI